MSKTSLRCNSDPKRLRVLLSPEELQEQASGVKLLLTDIDGCWTDGLVFFHGDGVPSVRFSVQDGYGVTMLSKTNIEIVAVSGRDCPAVKKRLVQLGITEQYMGSLHKEALAEKILSEKNLLPQEVAAFGDDLPDLGLFKHALISFAPPGARPEIIQEANYVTKAAGGAGAFREIAEILLKSQEGHE